MTEDSPFGQPRFLGLWRLQALDLIPDLRTVLGPLGEAIGETRGVLDGPDPNMPQDWIDSLVEETLSAIEDLLGTAFVVCQTGITRTVSPLMRLHRDASRAIPPVELRISSGERPHLCSLFSETVEDSDVTRVQLIDAAANYFKHRAEWKSWKSLRGQRTVQVLLSVGLSEKDSWPLQKVSEKLGNPAFCETYRFSRAIERWRTGLYAAYRAELERLPWKAKPTSRAQAVSTAVRSGIGIEQRQGGFRPYPICLRVRRRLGRRLFCGQLGGISVEGPVHALRRCSLRGLGTVD